MAGELAQPQEAEDERDPAADRDDPPADHEADEQAGDADGDTDRPHARAGKLRLVPCPLRIHPRLAPLSLCGVDSTHATQDCQRRNA